MGELLLLCLPNEEKCSGKRVKKGSKVINEKHQLHHFPGFDLLSLIFCPYKRLNPPGADLNRRRLARRVQAMDSLHK